MQGDAPSWWVLTENIMFINHSIQRKYCIAVIQIIALKPQPMSTEAFSLHKSKAIYINYKNGPTIHVDLYGAT